MNNYSTQIKVLRNASDLIQDAISIAFANNDAMSQGRMYAMQDAITAQIELLMIRDSQQNKKLLADDNALSDVLNSNLN